MVLCLLLVPIDFGFNYSNEKSIQTSTSLSIFKKSSAEARKRKRRYKKRRKKRRSKWANHYSKCKNKTRISSTVYYFPEERNFKTRRKFLSEVKIQGSGLQRNGTIRDYRGKTTKPPMDCRTTKISSSKKCLLSYFSVAADFRYHKPGDIIAVPAMKGKKIKLPHSKKTITHPGFFIVSNQGAAIKGSNRFDFFTGPDSAYSKDNPLVKMGFGNKKDCSRSFKKLTRNSAAGKKATQLIISLTDSLKDIPLSTRKHASKSKQKASY